MDVMSFESLCRCCLTTTGIFSSIFEIYNDYYLPKVISACTGVPILQSDGLPSEVCQVCLLKLVGAYETRRLFIRSHGQLKEQLQRLKQSEQEILIELNTTAAKCATSLLPTVESILDEAPITTWDNEINMHIEQLQDGGNELVTNIEAHHLDKLVIEKYENLEKGGYSFPEEDLVTPDDKVVAKDTKKVEDEPHAEVNFSDYSQGSDGLDVPEETGSGAYKIKEEPQNCPICSKCFRNPRLLQRHIQYHNANKSNCPICTKSFTHTSNLKRHLKSHKTPPDGFNCSVCGRQFDKGVQLYDHMKLHKPASGETTSYTLRCDHCEMETTTLAGFVAHMMQEHSVAKEQVKAFRCHICALRFVSKQGMLRHIEGVHENRKPVQSNPVQKKFLCTECGKCFQRMRHLEAHANSHTGVRPFICACGLAFAQQSGLNLHIRSKHENQRCYQCSICRKSFSQSTHLKHHELIHSNRKEHECTICKHRFRVKSNLVAHMRIHRKHPYCCSDCGREFVQAAKLELHMRKEHGS
ncbi:gastrula zinc finger protein XlCGF57.1-like [Wyeomyia smithii]|uniref:gastrula zinc finger protein XlCGF57.1-like n=1 Tax=Wyeomyia smithii TaxID=174621 RepID=UPI0024682084|nr:gastrula zinc finger protein XlCGF57.1-like [Wyeomyia smithii]